MNKVAVKLIISLSLIVVIQPLTIADQLPGKCHILLLDISGSMKSRYANNLKGWLVEGLLQSDAFSPGDRVLVRCFNNQGKTDFTPDDPLRRYNGIFNASQIIASLPQQVTPFDTDIPKALDQALADIRGLSIPGDILLWLITDNIQDVAGDSNTDPLYQKIVDEKNFRAAYVFPLLKENGSPAPANQAMVMYLLHYSPQKSQLNVNKLADEAGRKIGNEPVTWYPFQEQITLDQTSLTANSEEVQFVDGKLTLPAIQEDVPPDFTIQFRLTSQLRGREIMEGTISRVVTTLNDLPESVEAAGNPSSLTAQISPSRLAIKSKQTSSLYTLHLRADQLSFHAPSFWGAVFSSTSDPIDAVVEFTPSNIKTKMDIQSFDHVKNLSSIQKILQQDLNSRKPVRIPLNFRVEYNSAWRRVVAAVMALFAVAGICGVASALLIKTRYELSTPGGEHVFALPMIGKQYIDIDDDRAAVIKKRFGALRVAPLTNYTIDGGILPRRLGEGVESFIIEDQLGSRRFSYSIKRVANLAPESVTRDSILY